jgi:hypothetical protein
MDQAVMVFDDATERDTALGTAVVSEGMVSYVADSGTLEVYQVSGTAIAGWNNINLAQSANYLINGGMDVWQRGTATVTTNGAFAADRFIIGSSAGTNSVTRSTDVPTDPGVSYSLSFAGTSTTNPRIRQRIESINAAQFAGKTVTLSFYAKSSSGSAPIKVDTGYPTTTADTFGTWASPTVTADHSGLEVSPSGNAGSGWVRYSVSFVVSSNATRGYQIDLFRQSSASSTTTLYAGVQLELGGSVTPFKRQNASYQSEFSACQRYFQAGVPHGSGRALSTTSAQIFVNLPETMRATPVVTHNANYQILTPGVSFYTVTATANESIGTRGGVLNVTTSGMTSGNVVGTPLSDTGVFLSAEL